MDPLDRGAAPKRSGLEDTQPVAASPTDTRPLASQLEPSSARDNDGLSESFQSTDTVRRRPEAGYGSIASPSQASSAYFSDSATISHSHHHRTGATPTVPAGSLTRSPLLGPDRGRTRPRKPQLSRRTSSNAQALHRGGVFSVDDATSEVAADEAERQSVYVQSAASIRRRAAAPSLSRLHSREHGGDGGDDDDDDDDDGNDSLATPTLASANLPLLTPRDENVPADHPLDEDDLVALNDAMGDELHDEHEHEYEHEGGGDDDGDDDDDLSDAESFTLKDRQQAINQTHPFGIRLWKPALYKKDRSVQKTAEGDIHSSPGGHVSRWLLFFNIMWTLFFGVWLALIAFVGALMCLLFAAAPSGREYGRVLWGLSGYLFYPFGKFVRLEQQEPYLDEDQGEGRSISEYEQWQNGDLEYGRLFFGPERSRSIVGRSRRSIDSTASETDSLLPRSGRSGGAGLTLASDTDLPRMKRRLFGRGQWNVGRVIFFLFFYLLITPALFVVSGICWFLVFWIPMGRVTMLLFDHLRRHPLALSFESDIASARAPAAPQSSIIVCTYRAVGLKYWKYTVDGTNIFLINLMAVVLVVVVDWLVLDRMLHIDNFFTSEAFLFVAALLSIIPLAYFIGQAVASISAQSSMGLGAAINAFFSTIVEVFLYCVALNQGKSQLVEGSIIGSIFAGILFLPGLSMCFGAIKRKTQRFNARSAGVTSTMLLFAVIGAFSPTLFYQIYGSHQLNCQDCVESPDPLLGNGDQGNCRRCYFSQSLAIGDRFYLEAVRPYCYVAASLLFLSYIIGLWFTLRTHAAVIWNTEIEEKKHEEQQHLVAAAAATAPFTPTPRHHHASSLPGGDSSAVDIRDSHLYRRILGQSLRQVGLQPRPDPTGLGREPSVSGLVPAGQTGTVHAVPPKAAVDSSESDSAVRPTVRISGLSEAASHHLVRQVAEMAATAVTIAARDARARRTSTQAPAAAGSTPGPAAGAPRMTPARAPLVPPALIGEDSNKASAAHGTGGGDAAHGGHDAPNWSRLKSSVVLMGATVLYAIIAEILVDSVDFVLEGYSIDEKFLGITLFALVPNTTEFLNAISFAMNGNIALSMEIGSAYALQVCLLQIPALVLFSASIPFTADNIAHHTFSLLFPQWDMVTVILCVFLLSYMYGEGKSNYFKGSILLLSYLVVVVGYYFSGFTTDMDGINTFQRFDRMGADGQYISYARSFQTIGRGRSGVAF